MMKIIKIYCEGKKGGLDCKILEKVTEGLSHLQIEIDPIGSIRGARAIIQYKKEKDIVKPYDYILFRDRDFDKPIPPTVKLEQDKKRAYCYYSYLNTIENYLFDTSLFFSFLKQKALCQKYAINSEDKVKEKFIEAAENIKFYQAVRHTMGKMRTGETNFGTKWTPKSGILPEKLNEAYCKEKAWHEINAARLLAENSWSENEFLKTYKKFMEIFDKEFMENLNFLTYFQGKDFASSLKMILPDFPLKSYYNFAKNNFDYQKFDDLKELRELIKSL